MQESPVRRAGGAVRAEMSKAEEKTASSELPPPGEKQFYLQAFRGRAILFHLADPGPQKAVQAVVDQLVANRSMVVVVSDAARAAVGPGRRDLAEGSPVLARLAARLVESRLVRVKRPRTAAVKSLAFSLQLASRLGIGKVVLVDGRGGLAATGQGAGAGGSFVSAAGLKRLLAGDRDTGGWSHAELGLMLAALGDSVEAINLTSAEGCAAELFSYRGSGTLLSAHTYCRLGRLGVDDYTDGLRLLAKGEREGYLLARSEQQRYELLQSAYGAWFEHHRLAGVAALRTAPYRRSRLAEISGLYTISRFKGGGVGARLLAHLLGRARELKLRAVFACTADRAAGEFFERQGFVEVERGRVPASKWKGRKGDLPRVYWRDL